VEPLEDESLAEVAEVAEEEAVEGEVGAALLVEEVL
jgi:hypothetical protein